MKDDISEKRGLTRFSRQFEKTVSVPAFRGPATRYPVFSRGPLSLLFAGMKQLADFFNSAITTGSCRQRRSPALLRSLACRVRGAEVGMIRGMYPV